MTDALIGQSVASGGLPKPAISVCVPTYHRGHCLREAIQSALDQDFDNFEVVVADNASPDDTQAVLQSFTDPRIRNLRYDELVSMYANHNRCIKEARADWVVYLHSDERLLPTALSSIARAMADPRLTDVSVIFPDDPRTAPGYRYRPLRSIDALRMLLLFGVLEPSGTAFRREALIKTGGFNEAHDWADVEMYFRLALADEPFYTLKEATAAREAESAERSVVQARGKPIIYSYMHDAYQPFAKREAGDSFLAACDGMPNDLIAHHARCLLIAGNWRLALRAVKKFSAALSTRVKNELRLRSLGAMLFRSYYWKLLAARSVFRKRRYR